MTPLVIRRFRNTQVTNETTGTIRTYYCYLLVLPLIEPLYLNAAQANFMIESGLAIVKDSATSVELKQAKERAFARREQKRKYEAKKAEEEA